MRVRREGKYDEEGGEEEDENRSRRGGREGTIPLDVGFESVVDVC